MAKEIISEKEANEIIQMYAKLMMSYNDLGILAVYSIGSLAGGNYKPGKSDLDISVIIDDNSDIQKIESLSNEVISILKVKYGINIEMEAFLKKKAMLYPPYLAEQQKTIEIMRIKKQAKLIMGDFNKEEIPIPEKKDFINDAKYYEEELKSKFGQDLFMGMNEKQIINFIINYTRLYLILSNNEYEFNKDKLIKRYMEFEGNNDNNETEFLTEIIRGDYSNKERLSWLREFAKKINNKVKQFFFNDKENEI